MNPVLSADGRLLAEFYREKRTPVDLAAVPGYLKTEAWPGPGAAKARITYDAARADETAIREAISMECSSTFCL